MRKWIVRGLVFFSLGGIIAVAALYQFMTNPEAVRRQVLSHVQKTLVGVEVGVESARLKLFGGIEVKEMRFSRSDGLDRTDFAYIPSATIYHDKEQVLESGLRVRKVEIRRPRLRLVRDHNGKWNISGMTGPSDLNRRLPTILVQQGSLLIEDRRSAAGTPPLEIRDVNLTTINDPLPIVNFEGSGFCETAGLVRLKGKFERGVGACSVTLEVPQLTVGPELVQRVAGQCPDALVHLRRLNATGSLKGEGTYDPRKSVVLHYSMQGDVTDGEFHHARLPWPLRQIKGSFSCTDGVVPRFTLKAVSGATQVEATLTGFRLDLPPTVPLTDRADRFDATVKHVAIGPDLFPYLPENLHSLNAEYSPVGIGSVHLSLSRLGPGLWKNVGTFTAENMGGTYAPFRYPVQKAKGTIDWSLTTPYPPRSDAPGSRDDRMTLNVRGEAGGKPIFLRGTIEGEKATSAIALDVWGNDFPLDEQVLSLLPPRPQRVARHFDPEGKIDYRAIIRRERGQREVNKRFLFHLHDCTACYDIFPLPMTHVSGTVDLRADGWEFRDFVGRYNGGVVRASGQSKNVPVGTIARQTVYGSPDRGGYEEAEPVALPSRVSIVIEGENLPVDDGFKKALAPGREGLAKAVGTFDLTGRLNFNARIDDLPNLPRDIDVTVAVGGCRINPAFFPYPLEDVAATIRYAKNNVWVTGFQGRHGSNVFRIKQANVCLPPEGGFWTRLDRLETDGLLLDASLQRAMPPGIQKVVKMFRSDQPLDLNTRLIIRQAATDNARPTLYWDGTVKLLNATVEAGTELKNVTGIISSQGLHNGQQVEDVVGNVFLERAVAFGQPLKNVHLPLVIWKETPDILRLPDIQAELFGGTIGGEGRVEFGSIFRYEMKFDASRVQLEQLGSHNFGQRADLSGLAHAGIHLVGEGTELQGLKGHGRLDVPSGKMYRLPLMLDLLKWLGLRLPDRTAFEQARVEFRIEGPRLHIDKLDLFGNAVSVRGGGNMKLDGSEMNLDLNADWGQVMRLLPPPLGELTREVSNQLLRIKVRGKVSELKFEKELVPAVTDPLRKFWKGLVPPSQQVKRPGETAIR